MGLLRLLCNARVLGEDALTGAEAWDLYRTVRNNSRVEFSIEPGAIEDKWELLTRDRLLGSSTWTDLYLAAFAELRQARVVSFDHSFNRVPGSVVL